MAVQTPVITNISANTWKVVWGPVAAGDTFTPVPIQAGFANRSVQIEGTFGGATFGLQGSNDGTNYRNLNNLQNTAITTISAGAVLGVAELPAFIQPTISGGAGTSVTITLLLHGTI